MTDEVSKVTDPGLRTDVLGDDICRLCWATFVTDASGDVGLGLGLIGAGAANCCWRLVARAGETGF